MPPSEEEIILRLKDRAEIATEEIERRLISLKNEMKLKNNCDVLFEPIFGDIEKTFEKFEEAFFELIGVDRNQLK